MNIHIVTKALDCTPSLQKFIEEKVGATGRFLKSFEKEGLLDCFVEISRATRHHKRGEVFYAEIMVRLPGKTIRAESTNVNARAAITETRDIFKSEIMKYKERETKKEETHLS